MSTREKMLDDLARVAGGTVSVFSGLSQSIREDIKTRVDELADRLDLVPREDFERLEKRIEALEEKLSAQEKK